MEKNIENFFENYYIPGLFLQGPARPVGPPCRHKEGLGGPLMEATGDG